MLKFLRNRFVSTAGQPRDSKPPCRVCLKEVGQSDTANDNASDSASEQGIVCAHCRSATCMQCFTEQAEALGKRWWAWLRCADCEWMYWPTLFLDGSEQLTKAIVGEILFKKYLRSLLEDLATRVDIHGEHCTICYENRVGDFRACRTCQFPLCWQCFVYNVYHSTQHTYCPGCRGALDVMGLLQNLEASSVASKPQARITPKTT